MAFYDFDMLVGFECDVEKNSFSALKFIRNDKWIQFESQNPMNLSKSYDILRKKLNMTNFTYFFNLIKLIGEGSSSNVRNLSFCSS